MRLGGKPGLYALISLDGAPLAPFTPEDRKLLGLDTGAEGVRELPGIAVRACGSPSLIPAVHFHSTPDSVLAFAGYLDEPEDLAASLGLPPRSSPAELASVALDRFTAEAPWHMLGEWSLLRWSVHARELTLLTSENACDQLFWAANAPNSPSHIAVAPDLLQLGRLPWVGLTLEPKNVALYLSRAGLRRIRDRDTVWKGIYAVQPGTREVFSPNGRQTIPPAPEPAQKPWLGSFEDAVEALNTLGRRIVGQNLSRYGPSAILLSGGLDSTLLAALGAQERSAGAMFCLTSAAPEGSGLADEREFSEAAAQQLGFSVRLVSPGPEARVYRPSEGNFAFLAEPVPSSRHYLYDALRRAALEEGANAIFDGVAGEMTITEKPDSGFDVDWMHRIVYATREWKEERRRRAAWPAGSFHARFSPVILSTLPADWREIWRQGMPQRPALRPGDLRGVHPALAKNASADTATPEGLRRLFPFRDRRLVRFAAGLPFGFGEHGGQSRAMARAMLLGRVPDSVRLRPRGMPFSPDYERRMAREAPQARKRIEAFRAAGVGRWLDLDWLAAALDRLAAGADSYHPEQSQAQLTAMTGEFLLWCQTVGVRI